LIQANLEKRKEKKKATKEKEKKTSLCSRLYIRTGRQSRLSRFFVHSSQITQGRGRSALQKTNLRHSGLLIVFPIQHPQIERRFFPHAKAAFLKRNSELINILKKKM
jgi:hypothetical protein